MRQKCRVAEDHPTSASVLLDVFHPRRRQSTKHVDNALWVLGLIELAYRLPSELSQGQRTLAGVARAMSSGPRVLLLDEPAAGLDTAESRVLGADLRTVVDHGVSILLVDHDTRLVLDVCDRIYVLEFGAIVAEGSPEAIRVDERVIEAYLGWGSRGEQSREGGET